MKLKPCPFCGGEANKSACALDYPTCNVRAYAWCKQCGAEIHKDGNVKISKQLLKEAMSAWNNRSEPPNKPLTLEELENSRGEPLWIVLIAKSTGKQGRSGWVISGGFASNQEFTWAGYSGLWGMMNKNNYGKAWLAYHHKPKEATL